MPSSYERHTDSSFVLNPLMKFETLIESNDYDEIANIIYEELKKRNNPSNDFQHEVVKGVEVVEFDSNKISIAILEERLQNWMEDDEHLFLVEYFMDILNRKYESGKDDYEMFGYAMEGAPAFDIPVDRIYR